ncbi:hypothetical protein O6H91_19G069600 [Diphasiastrum complanatum]|uniref:Uncharacterized protein n=2 Tax=Diphasiastrum complanatum TaxID=34168 RepID=A0ACC2AWE8_DIPCM|nr:hypothetical protein O6H91_19G069600 [Diphasiastrum complanatum]
MANTGLDVELVIKKGKVSFDPKLRASDTNVSTQKTSLPVFESHANKQVGEPDSYLQKMDTESTEAVKAEAGSHSNCNLPDLISGTQTHKYKAYNKLETLMMAYQTLGVVYGDLATSPLYVYPTMSINTPNEKDYLGILSLIIWTLTAIGLFKYVLLVLHADDNGEGGTFALYSKLYRHMKVGQKTKNKNSYSTPVTKLNFFDNFKDRHVSSNSALLLDGRTTTHRVLLFISMLGTCMLIGDGILTPAISVLSAMDGIQQVATQVKSIHYPGIFKAFSPHHIISFFSRNGKDGWLTLGGTALCITGAEAMFADLGHFNRPSIQLAFSTMVYPSVIVTYAGQTAYLIKHPADHNQAFYKFLPQCVYWPMFVIATLAAVVASQGLISAAFSIIKQSVALDYFPRVTLVHTSTDKEGQVYSPEVNYCLMLMCLLVLFGFGSGPEIGNAFGVAVMFVMIITTILMTVVMLEIWKTRVLALVFFLIFILIEGTYLSAVVIKFPKGGWLPFIFAFFLAIMMFSWYYGRQKKCECEMKNRINLDQLGVLLARIETHRVPGLCLFYTDLINEVPPVIIHYVNNIRSLHQVIIFTTIRYVPVTTVSASERFFVEQLGYKGIYRCVAQYGYTDMMNLGGDEFMNEMVMTLTMYLQSRLVSDHGEISSIEAMSHNSEDITELEYAKEAGVVYVLGKTSFKINQKTGWVQRILLGNFYNFLHNNCRSAMAFLKIPVTKHMEIGMLYEV